MGVLSVSNGDRKTDSPNTDAGRGGDNHANNWVDGKSGCNACNDKPKEDERGIEAKGVDIERRADKRLVGRVNGIPATRRADHSTRRDL